MKANGTEQPKTFGEWRAARFARERRRAARITREIANTRATFRNDLAEYRYSDEGRALAAALNGEQIEQIRRAADVYYTARECGGFHYADENMRLNARALDKMLAAKWGAGTD